MISGIILASGFSKRMGADKLLIKIDKIPLVKRVIDAAVPSSLDKIILVYKNEEILNFIKEKAKITTCYNELAYEGQSAAIKKGIENSDKKSRAYLFMVGDQPFLDTVTINKIINLHKKYPQNIIVPLYHKNAGNPVLFPSAFKSDLLNLKNDTGGRNIIQEYKNRVKYITIPRSYIGIDIDTEKDLERI